MLEADVNSYDTHAYAEVLKREDNAEFVEKRAVYRERYSLPTV
jgi:hypothetical protein